MPSKSLTFCKHHGCNQLTNKGYCEQHMPLHEQQKAEANKRYEKSRGSAASQGYDYAWSKYSKAFLRKPENQICKLHLPGCTIIARCVDHIKPPRNKHDPLFKDPKNHQAACIHCNSVKGHKEMVGTYDVINELDENDL